MQNLADKRILEKQKDLAIMTPKKELKQVQEKKVTTTKDSKIKDNKKLTTANPKQSTLNIGSKSVSKASSNDFPEEILSFHKVGSKAVKGDLHSSRDPGKSGILSRADKDLYSNLSRELDSDINEEETKSWTTKSTPTLSNKSSKAIKKVNGKLDFKSSNNANANANANANNVKPDQQDKELQGPIVREQSNMTISLDNKMKDLKNKEKVLLKTLESLEKTIEERSLQVKTLEKLSKEIESKNKQTLEGGNKKNEVEKSRVEITEKLLNMETKLKGAEDRINYFREKEKETDTKLTELEAKAKELVEKEKNITLRARKVEERTKTLVTREESVQTMEYALQEKQRFLLAKESGLVGREEFVQMEENDLKKKETDLIVFDKTYEERRNLLIEKENSIAQKETAFKEFELSLRLQATAFSSLGPAVSINQLENGDKPDSATGDKLVGKTESLTLDRVKFYNSSTYGVINKKGKILITGTGRCGTTFLMILFTLLGLGTGYDPEKYHEAIFTNCNSGLEKNRITKNQRVYKNPKFLHEIGTLSMNLKIIGCVIIPMRNYEDAAKSRFKIGINEPGGLWEATNVEEQITFYNKIISDYILQMVRWSIPTIFLDFDKMINSPQYLYTQLLPILDKISYDAFEIAYNKAGDDQKKK